MSKIRVIIYFLISSLWWGGSFFAIHHVIHGFSITMGVFLRVFVALLVVAPYVLIKFKNKIVFNRMAFKTMLIGTLGMTIPWLFLFYGEKFIQPAVAGIINATVPILVLFLMIISQPKDKVPFDKWMGLLLGFVGIVVIFYPELSIKQDQDTIVGLLAIALMAVSYAFSILGTRKMGQHFPSELNLFYQILGSVVCAIPFVLITPQPWILPDFTSMHVIAIIYLGAFSSALAMFCFFRIVHEVGSVEGAAITFFVPVVAITLDAVFLNAWIKWWQALGAILILSGLFFVNRQKKKPIQYK